MLLVAGAAGILREAIVARLRAAGYRVRLATNPGESPPSWSAPDLELVPAATSTEADIEALLAGIDAVVIAGSPDITAPDGNPTVYRRLAERLVVVAQTSRVRRLVLVSAAHADATSPCSAFAALGHLEALVMGGARPWTILAAAPVMDVWVPAVVGESAIAHRPVTLPADGTTLHPFIAASDVVAYVLAALANPSAADRRLLLAGPDGLSWRDVIRTYEWLLGRPIQVRPLRATASTPDLSADATRLLLAHETIPIPLALDEPTVDDLSLEFGIVPTPLDVVARRYLASNPLTFRAC